MARNLRGRDDEDRDEAREDDRPRRRKKKAKKGGSGLTLILVLLAVAALIGGGVFLIISLSGGKGAEKSAVEDDKDRALGAWQGTAPDHPTMTLALQVFPNRIVFSASEAKAGRGKELSFARLSDRMSGKNLVLRLEGPDRPFEWSISFTSDDEMHVQSLTDPDSPPRHYKRLGKYVSKEERAAAAEKEKLRIVGDWDVPRLESSTRQKGVLHFAADGTAKFDFTLNDGGKLESLRGTWKALEVKDNLLRLQLAGLGDFDKIGIEFLSDNEIHFSFYSARSGGVQHSAKRLR